jgi:hypothetical protein
MIFPTVKRRLLASYIACLFPVFGDALAHGTEFKAFGDDKDCRLALVEMESRFRAVLSEVEILRGAIRLCGNGSAVISVLSELRAHTSKVGAPTVSGGEGIDWRGKPVVSLAKVEAVLRAERVVIVSVHAKPDFRDGQEVRLGAGSFVSRVVDTRENSFALQLPSPAFDSLALKVGQSVYVY